MMVKVTLGIFADIDDFDVQGYIQHLARESGRASVLLTTTPDQFQHIPKWKSVSQFAAIWLRVNWGYYGRGTLPLHGTPEAEQFLRSVRRLFSYEWLSGIFVGNEPNNPQEWPSNGVPLTAESVARWVSIVWRMAPIKFQVGLPPVDLFNASYDNPYSYLEKIVKNIQESKAWIEFSTVQLKTQTSASPLIQERYRFSHPPLIGESMNLGAAMKALSTIYRYLSPSVLVVPEMNPQRKTTLPFFNADDKSYGWPYDTRAVMDWIDTTVRTLEIAIHAFPIREVFIHIYRWSRDDWEIRNRPDVLNSIVEIAKRIHR